MKRNVAPIVQTLIADVMVSCGLEDRGTDTVPSGSCAHYIEQALSKAYDSGHYAGASAQMKRDHEATGQLLDLVLITETQLSDEQRPSMKSEKP